MLIKMLEKSQRTSQCWKWVRTHCSAGKGLVLIIALKSVLIIVLDGGSVLITVLDEGQC